MDGPETILNSATVLVMVPDVHRRDRFAGVLSTIPANLLMSPSCADAYVQLHHKNVAVVVVDGHDDPRGAIDFFKKLRATQPFVVSVLIGIEWDRMALMEAVNDIHAHRLLPNQPQDYDLRAAVLSGLAVERERREVSRMNRTWVRDLLNKVEAALPSAEIRQYEERGESLPLDLIRRPGRTTSAAGTGIL